jgi:hypothetical protein
MLREPEVNVKLPGVSRQLENAYNKRLIKVFDFVFDLYCSLTIQYAQEGGESFICI